MTVDPTHTPGRRATVDALTNERFSDPIWWETQRPELVDSKLMQGIRRRALSEAVDGTEDMEETA